MAVLAAWAFARAALQHRRRAGEQSNQSDRHRRAGVSLVRDGQGALALRRLYFTKENTNTGAAASCGELDADRPVAGLVRFGPDRPRGNAGRPSAKQGADYILTLLEDSRARIRCGTAAGVSLFDPAAGGDAPFSAISMGMPAGQGSTVETLAEDRLGTMWIGAADGILYAVHAHATKPASIAQRPAPAPGESLSSTCSDRWTAR